MGKTSKNILIVTQYFYPEEFKINDLAEELVRRGHRVTVLTGKPNYPQGEFYKGYRFWGVKEEDYKGAKVVRVPLLRRRNGGSRWLVLNYLSFVFFGCLYVLFHKLTCDSIFCFETSPITQAYPAILAKYKTKAKMSMWVQDLWPESVSAASNIKNARVIRMIENMVRYIYDKCDILFVQSKAFVESIMTKGDYQSKIVYAPNWAEDIFTNCTVADVNKYKVIIPDGFVVMFAGNIGEAQDFESIIRAASLTHESKHIKWVIVGDGRNRRRAEELINQYAISETVSMIGRYPMREMPHFFVHADVMLVTLKNDYIFSLTIPSKTQAYMAFGKPIATMIDGIGNSVVEEAKCGLVSHSGDYHKLANNILTMSKLNKEELLKMGQSAKEYYNKEFDKNKVIDTIESYL